MKFSRKQKMVVIGLTLIAILLVSSWTAVFFFYNREQVIVIEEQTQVVRPDNYTMLMTKTWEEMQSMSLPSDFPLDTQINPYLDEQAIVCEIVRIRARGIENVMRKLNLQWKTPPSFYYVVHLHDTEHTSKQFSTWDTGFIGQEMFRRVNNEQETAEVSISIFEKQSAGILGLRSQYVEKEKILLTYCFRTGRWSGMNYFGHPDGYGRYLGENFEVWFAIRQSDHDADGIPYWIETNLLLTDPSVNDKFVDHDGDGIPTFWEWYWGFDPFTMDNHSTIDISKDGLSNVDKYNLAKWYADPYQPEIYIEVDFMKGKPFGRDNVLWEESKQLLLDRFSQRKYHLTPWASKITIYIDDGSMGGGGEMLPHIGEYISQETGIVSEFYKNNFADERKGVFRYMVMVHDAGWCHPQDYKGWYDVMCIGASQRFYLKWFRGFNVRPQLQRLVQSIQLMHELGHSLGLNYYEGIDNASTSAIKYWRNYQSCMNYQMMYRPFLMRFAGKNYGLVLDYSDGSRNEPDHPDQNDWGIIDLRYFKRPTYMEGLE